MDIEATTPGQQPKGSRMMSVRQPAMVLGLCWDQLEDTLSCHVADGEMPEDYQT